MGWNRRLKLVLSFSLVLLFLPLHAGLAYGNEGTLIPMGHSIGIKMDLSGVFVTNDVMLDKDLWLKAGDLIEEVDSVSILKLENIEKTFSGTDDKQAVTLVIVRNNERIQVQSDNAAIKRLIPFLKDKTEGTGTLTYVDPKKGIYGALGHQIIDSSFNSPPSFTEGSIYLSKIGQIRKSVPGHPGYKISTILKDDNVLGSINKNGIYGIFGSWNDAYKKVLAEPLEIMQPSEVKEGEAEIFTTVKGTEVESFSVMITNVEKDQFHFTLTDSKLLETTGGILQGMSGSPVIQNGKFAGAVTHMFVDEPEKGAALFLTTMRTGEK
ncbi:SpoIVB peptidase S55 domain-containing protein [Sporosarcina sp. G11-34]|uniref:SpoIVB peptidase S55 domain-containing protein n=1 Tax=Sporosarcina sp. G11-34 TaxID=2849605 RepID=UPI0022A9F04D|nr:SpoIVB peptidase S55 domain-containing protein [Sporosarcina sp. G11-34]MCZ2260119.1 peptidase [Sporosarcina sp. G11-34]